MTTTAVQQAPQMAEIQGSPAIGPASGDTFRATFVASVGGTTAAKTLNGDQGKGSTAGSSGLSSAKQTPVVGLLAQSTSMTPSEAIHGLPKLEVAGEEDATLIVKVADSSNRNSGSERAVAEPASSDLESRASSANDDLRSGVLTPASDEKPISAAGPAALPLTASGSGVSNVGQKDDGLGDSPNGGAVKGRKNEASGSKEQSSTTVQGSLPAHSVTEDAIALTAVPTAFALTFGDDSTAQAGTKRAVLTSVNAASDLVPLPQGTNESVTLQQQGFGSTVAVRDSVTTKDDAAIGNLSSLAVKATGSTLNSAKSDQIGGAIPLVVGRGASLAQEIPVAGAASGSVAGSLTGSLTGVSQAKSAVASTASASTNGLLQGNRFSSESSSADASQTRGVQGSHAGVVAQTVNAPEKAASKGVGSDTTLAARVEVSSTGNDPHAAPEGVLPTDGGVISTQAGGGTPLQLSVAHESVAASPALRDASLKAASAPVKDAKAKATADVSEQTSGAASSVPQVVPVAGPSVSPNSLPALAGGVAQAVAVAAGVGAPTAQGTSHSASAANHGAVGEAGAAVAARAQVTESAGSLAEAASAGGQMGDSHRTLLATPTTLEVGVQSGTQGWVKIRAEVGDQGAVNASLAAGSTGGRELLHSQMPALNAFLHSEQMAVTTTVVDRGTLAGGGGMAMGSGGLSSHDGSGSNNSLLQGGGAQSDGARQNSSQQTVSLGASETARSYADVAGAEGSSSIRASASEDSGRWLNVRV